MKAFITLFSISLCLSSGSAWAARGDITITPGSSITLEPNEKTTVTCNGDSQKKILLKFCRCDQYTPHHYAQLYLDILLSDGQTVNKKLWLFNNQGECASQMNTFKECK